MHLKERKKKFTIPIIDGSFYVLVSNDINKSYRKWTGEDEDVLGATFFKKDKSYILIGIDSDYSTVLHEAAHMTFFGLGRVGIECKEGEPNEMYCYTLEWIYDKILRFQKKVQEEIKSERKTRKKNPQAITS